MPTVAQFHAINTIKQCQLLKAIKLTLTDAWSLNCLHVINQGLNLQGQDQGLIKFVLKDISRLMTTTADTAKDTERCLPQLIPVIKRPIISSSGMLNLTQSTLTAAPSTAGMFDTKTDLFLYI